ncbi:hypothetical protein SAMN05444166_4824 [Singulisphaera sp. GP187]|uniref:hypothetical protein n=1 Tax=Singulisphaera sp. GP187 TaxID=1882752 RepID=UPI00092C34AA|nr:hypothetical protein [Singulisphaera sp. GP187]SIO44976.1 hypothetical protein SAMN05444166_4824 [Singulisphaera sp. GP187]
MGRFLLAKRHARFGVATLMLLVALSAVAVCSYMRISEKIAKLERARARYAAKADSNAIFRKAFEMSLKNQPKSENRAWLSEQARYYGDLEKKYTKAASAPWTVVEPDPPRPPLVPTEEQLAKWETPLTRAALIEKANLAESHRNDYAIKPYVPRRLSDLTPP